MGIVLLVTGSANSNLRLDKVIRQLANNQNGADGFFRRGEKSRKSSYIFRYSPSESIKLYTSNHCGLGVTRYQFQSLYRGDRRKPIEDFRYATPGRVLYRILNPQLTKTPQSIE